jgi:putative tryptophan/tyrosine transport system substrate-binding protein
MRRRDLIILLGSGAVAWPLAARSQQRTIPVVGYIGTGSRDSDAFRLPSFYQGLRETGYIEGQNVLIEYRWAEGQNDRLPTLVADLVGRQVTVIALPASTPGALAAKAVTTTTPIVFYIGLDPVELGLVDSLNHPGGNITGVTGWNVMVGPKRLELLHELIPSATILALLVNPTSPNLAEADAKEQQAAAHTLGVELRVVHSSSERDFDNVFAAVVNMGAGGLVIGTDSLFNTWKEELAALSIRHRVPTIHQYREFAAAGGLIGYGTETADLSRLVGVYTGRILKGEKPADMPISQATKVGLFINLKTSATLGLTIPPALLARADEVFE